MPRPGKLIELIHEELARIGCKEIRLAGEGEHGRLHIVRNESLLSMKAEAAHHALFVVPSYAGDDVAWDILANCAGSARGTRSP